MGIHIIIMVILILIFVGYKYYLYILEERKKRLEEARLDAKYKRLHNFSEVELYPTFHKLTFLKMDGPPEDDRIKDGNKVTYNVKDKYECMKKCEVAPLKEVNCYPKTKAFADCLSGGSQDCYNKFNYKNMFDYSTNPIKIKVGCNSYLYNVYSKNGENNTCTIHRSCPNRMDEFEFNKGQSYFSEFGYIRNKPLNYMLELPYNGNSNEEIDNADCKKYCNNIKGCKKYAIYKDPTVISTHKYCRLTL